MFFLVYFAINFLRKLSLIKYLSMYIVHGINTVVLLSRGLQIDKVKAERCPCVCGSQVNTSHMSICRFMEVNTKNNTHSIYISGVEIRNFLFFDLICSLTAFLTLLMKYFQIQLILPSFAPKRDIFDFSTYNIFWYYLFFAFLAFTRIFWRKLSIFQFNLFVFCFS